VTAHLPQGSHEQRFKQLAAVLGRRPWGKPVASHPRVEVVGFCASPLDMSQTFATDHEMVRQGMVMYDAALPGAIVAKVSRTSAVFHSVSHLTGSWRE